MKKNPLIIKVKKANHLIKLIKEEKNGKLLYSPSKSNLKKVVECIKNDSTDNKTPKNANSIYQNVVFIIDYFHRLNPNNQKITITSVQWTALLGEQYSVYINALVKLSIFDRQEHDLGLMYTPIVNNKSYIVEKYSYSYCFSSDAFMKLRSVSYFDEKAREFLTSYVEDINNIIDNKQDNLQQEVTNKLSWLMYFAPKFVAQYNESLKHTKLQLTKRELNKIVNNAENEEDRSRLRALLRNFEKEKYIKTVDNSLRIYSSMTNLPRDIRKYINYSWSVDIHNSHPLLLTMLLREFFKYGSIKRYINYIFGFSKDGISNDSVVKSEIDSKMPKDVVEYIYMVNDSKVYKRTNFWSILTNDLIDLMNEKLENEKSKKKPNTRVLNRLKGFQSLSFEEKRSLVKEKVFTNIFYNKGKIWENSSEVVQVFMNRFPNVVKIVELMKKEIHKACINNKLQVVNYVKKEGISKATGQICEYSVPKYQDKWNLASLIMKLESFFMLEILSELYKATHNSAYFVSIHDAIYCIGKYKHLKSSKIARELINKYYNTFGMYPRIGEESSKYKFEDGEIIDLYPEYSTFTTTTSIVANEEKTRREDLTPQIGITEAEFRFMLKNPFLPIPKALKDEENQKGFNLADEVYKLKLIG